MAPLALARLFDALHSVVTLDNEWGVVWRDLEVEHIRFGERLRVRAEMDPDPLHERIPSFALQTLVENAMGFEAVLVLPRRGRES